MKMPKLKVRTNRNVEINLQDLKGQKIVMFFYPKDNTPGCTTEGIEFNGLLKQFEKLNCVVLGVSRDSVKSHDKFCADHGFKFNLVSDAEEELCKFFNVIKEKNMYGKKVFGIERSSFIFDETLNLVAEFRKVKAPGHAAHMLEEVKKL